ncbi:MAG: tRNA pseudouridine synthase [Mycobacterium sp.]|nr:tRNA pseudouridine synthase [Mycobacterium sp.]
MTSAAEGPAPDGIVVVDKPAGWTSHDVVGRSRRLARTKKVGHAGTLDPMATGILILGIGRATRLLGHLALTDKTYLATIRLGATTVTDDAEGDFLVTTDAGNVTDEQIAAAIADLTGDIEQIPSSVSAIKVDGVRSYAKVRAGQEVDLAARPVTVSRFALLERRGDDLDVEVDCSTGTYVRALARDLGQALQVGAHLTALRRTRVGSFDLASARSLELLEEGFDEAVVPLDAAVALSFSRRDLTEQEAIDLSYGKKLTPTGRGGTVGAFAPDGGCVGLIVDRHDVAKASVVFRPA